MKTIKIRRALRCVAGLALLSAASAWAVTATPVFPQAIRLGIGQITNADTTTLKTLFTAGSNGSLVQAIGCSSTDTSNRDLVFYITRSATDYQIATIQAPLSAGNTNAIAAIDVLRHAMWPWPMYDMAGNRQLRLMSGDVLKVASTATITSAKLITCFADGQDL